jgi:hypothetical protein
MSKKCQYFAQLSASLPKVKRVLKMKGIKKSYLNFGGVGKKPKQHVRVPTDANSEFLANRAMGDWAEQRFVAAINRAIKELIAVPYGNSDRMAAGEAGFKEFYLRGVEETQLHGKRPDLLLFKSALKSVPKTLSTYSHRKAARFVKMAVAAIEVRSSKFDAVTFMAVRKKQRADGKKVTRETPSFTVKVEDLVVVYRWIEQSRLPQVYCQVFFDTVYAINFLEIFRVIGSGEGFKIEQPRKSQKKATIMIPITRGFKVGEKERSPRFTAKHRITELGRHDAYVVPQGGGFELDAVATRKVLLVER